MLKRLMVLFVVAASLVVAGCSSCGGGAPLHCEAPCYGKSMQRSARQMADFVDVYFLNYDRHDPFRCEPCVGR